MIEKFMVDFLLAFLIDHKEVILISIFVLAKEVFEYWLGKTDKVQAGSSLELLLLTIKKIKGLVKKNEN